MNTEESVTDQLKSYQNKTLKCSRCLEEVRVNYGTERSPVCFQCESDQRQSMEVDYLREYQRECAEDSEE